MGKAMADLARLCKHNPSVEASGKLVITITGEEVLTFLSLWHSQTCGWGLDLWRGPGQQECVKMVMTLELNMLPNCLFMCWSGSFCRCQTSLRVWQEGVCGCAAAVAAVAQDAARRLGATDP